MNNEIQAVLYEANPNGLVLWCSDWIAAFELAAKNQGGFSTRAYGPEYLGHVDLFVDSTR
jgi:hypothetical protein